MPDGRFAPSPTGDLHLGNLRTALVAWLFARSSGSRFFLRMEDLDRVTSSIDHETAQRRDLTAIGLDWDGEVVRQSERFERYDVAIAALSADGLTYSCFCSRREIREAAAAPHGTATPAYPGTCRNLTSREQADRQRTGRRPALRLRADGVTLLFADRLAGRVEGVVDDVVLRRNDGVPAYNLAVVVDDAAQGVAEVVRGDDLLPSTVRHLHIARRLGLPEPSYAHVPMVFGPDGVRLAKRHGAVTLADRVARGESPAAVLSELAVSLDLAEPGEPVAAPDLVDRFDPSELPRQPWILEPSDIE